MNWISTMMKTASQSVFGRAVDLNLVTIIDVGYPLTSLRAAEKSALGDGGNESTGRI
jgi:hypothetical protein